MQKKTLFIMLCLTLATLILIPSCTSETTPAPSTATSAPAATSTTIPQADWWDKFGEPEYGGTMTMRYTGIPFSWDVTRIFPACFLYEPLFDWNYTIDHENIYSYTNRWIPPDYWQGHLAESWEWADPQTLVVHLRQGVYWQDKEPVNGREFTAYDVEHHYDRLLGNGSGYTEPAMMLAGFWGAYDTVTANDDYTVTFKFKAASIPANTLTIFDVLLQDFEAPELIAEYGGITDWTQVVSTGPWMLTDYVENSSMTLSRNPDYWAYDDRYPENQLPYLDEVHILTIPDPSTAISALRTGKLDVMSQIEWQQAQNLLESNPELMSVKIPVQADDLQLRVDKEPFTDINVRKALQVALDRELIAQTHFGGMSDGKPCGLMWPDYTGWVIPFDDWPEDLKAEYTYNPEKAQQLLAEAGYPDGFETSVAASNTLDLTMLEIIKAMFMDIGVDMAIEVSDNNTINSMLNAGKLEQMYYQWSPAGLGPTNAVTTAGDTHPQFHHNDAAYADILARYNAAGSLEEMQELAIEADMYYLSQHWSIVTCPSYDYTIWQPRIKGYQGERMVLYLGTPAQGGLSWAKMWIRE